MPPKFTVDTDPHSPYITLVAAPSQVLPLVELAEIMAHKWDYQDDPEGAAAQATRALTLIRVITDRTHGIVAQFPDDLWEGK